MISEDDDRLEILANQTRQGELELTAQGSKNVGLHLVAGAMVRGAQTTLLRLPDLLDFDVLRQMLDHLGAEGSQGDGDISFSLGSIHRTDIPSSLGRRVRPTICYAAAVAELAGSASCPLPGGDAFAPRPIDAHLRVLEAAGYSVSVNAGLICLVAAPQRQGGVSVSAATSYGPSLGATATAIIIAARHDAEFEVLDPSTEPEILGLLGLLGASGLRWEYDSDMRRLTLHGGSLSQDPLEWKNAPDRIATGTWILWAAARRQTLAINGCSPTDLPSEMLRVFDDLGVRVDPRSSESLITSAKSQLRPVVLDTGPYPGFPTDLQPQLSAALTTAAGPSIIRERVYPRRGSHIALLRRFGARIQEDGNTIEIAGRQCDLVAPAGVVVLPDIRAGAAVIVASGVTTGPVKLDGFYHLRRGYENIQTSLRSLGYQVAPDLL